MSRLRSTNHYIFVPKLSDDQPHYGAKTLRDWYDLTGVKPNLILDRIARGWSKYDAVMTPPRAYKSPAKAKDGHASRYRTQETDRKPPAA